MDNNPVVTPQPNPLPLNNNPVVSPVANVSMPQTPPTKSNLGRNLLMIISAVLIVVILAATGYLLFLGNAKQTTKSAQVYNQPIVPVSPTVAPIPAAYQINPKDTSDNAISNDTTAVNQNLNNLDSELNNVDQSFNDQQTNLQ